MSFSIGDRSFLKKKRPQSNKSIIFGITKLDLGGAERVLVDMCNNLCDEYDITIFTIYSGGVLERELKPEVKLVSLYKKQNKVIPMYLFLFGKIVYNKYLKDRYDKEIAFLEGPITRLFSYPPSKIKSQEKASSKDVNNIEQIKNILNDDTRKKVAWVHNDIKKVFGNGIKAKLKMLLDKRVYKKYDLVVFVSEDNKKSFNELYGDDFNEKVIYNFIDKDRVLKVAEEKIDDKELLLNQKDIGRKNTNNFNCCKINKAKGDR